MKRRQLVSAALVAAALGIPVFAQGCGTENPLCCTEFKVGATLDANIGGSAQSQVTAQAVADIGGIASAAVDDLTTACRGMAQELDAPKADQDAAEAKTDKRQKLDAWCKLAVQAVGSMKAKAGGTLTIAFDPPKCEASISAKANCQAKCSVDGKCDVHLHPPKCSGSLQVACKGECKAKANVALKCEGTCKGTCKGSCTAQGGVKCAGKCEGTCEGAGGAGTNGTDAQGNCQGTCKGTCEVTAPGAECQGSCKGECSLSCVGSANASVTCDGDCQADYEPIRCEGGKLEGGCEVDAKCDASCDASVSAKAECTPPEVRVTFAGAANLEAAGKLQAVLEANMGLVYAFQARLDGIFKATGTLKANAGAVTDLKAACLVPMATAAFNAVEDVGASLQATGSIVASVK